jgi:hypothetical protein
MVEVVRYWVGEDGVLNVQTRARVHSIMLVLDVRPECCRASTHAKAHECGRCFEHCEGGG